MLGIWFLVGAGELAGGFEHECVDECLRQVAAKLALVDVVLLGVQAGGPAEYVREGVFVGDGSAVDGLGRPQ